MNAPVNVDGNESSHKQADDSSTTATAKALDLSQVQISWCAHANTNETKHTTLAHILEYIRLEKCRGKIENIRCTYQSVLEKTGDKEQAKKAVDDVKKSLLGFLPGKFRVRQAAGLEAHAGFIVYDADDTDPEPVMERIPHCPYALFAFRSPKGNGVKIGVRVAIQQDGGNHKACWHEGKRIIEQQLGVKVDEAPKSVASLCFVSSDARLYVNTEASEVRPVEEQKHAPREQEQKRKRAKPNDSTTRPAPDDGFREEKAKPLFQFDEAVVRDFVHAHTDDIDARKVVKALSYIEPSSEAIWREVMMALKSRWGDDAWDLADEWSACGAGYDADENRKRWDSFHDDAESGITLGTIFHHAKAAGWIFYDKQGVLLPIRNHDDFLRRSYKVMFPTHSVFLQGGSMVCIERIDGRPQIVSVDSFKGIRLFERHIQFLKRQPNKNTGEESSVPVPLPEKYAKLLVKGVQPDELPELRGITNCPVLVERTYSDRTQQLRIAETGYIPETGWYNASELRVPDVPLEVAVRKLKWLYREFEFPTPGDRSRALVFPIGVALKLSGLLHGFVPLEFGTANDQQSGKGTRQRMTAAFFGATMEIITQSESHIGGASEMFKSACLTGRTFIELDNFDHFACREMEAFLTGENIRARDAFGRARTINPANHFVFLSSNGLAARRDLALRSWFIHILKKPVGHQFHSYAAGGILEHIAAKHAEYLGCVYAIIFAWWQQGSKRTDETRHAFRDFTQVCDWISRHILQEAPVMEGHNEAVQRYSDAGRVFFTRLWDVLEKDRKLNTAFRAGQLATTAFRYSIPVPGVNPGSRLDERAGAKLIGAVAADMFDGVPTIDLGHDKRVERMDGKAVTDEHLVADDQELRLPATGQTPCYIFRRSNTASNRPDADRDVRDALADFRDSLVAALVEDGRTFPCVVSTEEIASMYQHSSVKSVGRWIAKLAERWPERFGKADKHDFRGWRIS